MSAGDFPPASGRQDTRRSLAKSLREMLAPLVRESGLAGDKPGAHRLGQRLFSYRCFVRERVARMRVQHPLIGIILSGNKEIWLGDEHQSLGPGEVFVLPGNLDLEVANIPDARNGRYESLVVEVSRVPPELAGVAALGPALPAGANFRVRLTEELVDSLVHAARALRAPDHAAALAGIRLSEVLVLLSGDLAAAPLFRASLEERVAWLVLGEPGRRWTSLELGRALGLGASTLRRRLADRGTSLRAVLSSARLGIAHRMLTTGDGTVSEAAVAAGYASRSHFVRRFKTLYGAAPSAFRPR